MKEREYQTLQGLPDMMVTKVTNLHKAGAFAELIKQLELATEKIPDSYSVAVKINLVVSDDKKEQEISLGYAELSARDGKSYPASSMPVMEKFLVDGEAYTVPSIYCPHCWNIWDLKLLTITCPHCKYELGGQIKLILDSDLCPYCHKGGITANNPKCSQCGRVLDPQKIVWPEPM